MIENIRKFRILIVLGLAAVALGLVLGIKDDVLRGGTGGQAILRIDGRTYGDKEFNRLGSGAMEIMSSLAGSGDFSMYQYVIALSSGSMGDDSGREQFFINRILLRKAAEELGIHPGDEEVANQIRTMRPFSGEDQKFNEERYRRFVDRGIGRLGLTENDFLELVADYLAFQKIMNLTGPGLTENRDATAARAALESQQINGEIASLSIDDFEKDIQPTEEQLKEYWETLRDSFTTEPRRKFSYLIATPDMPKAEEDPKESVTDATLTEEQKKAKEEEKAKKAAKLAEERRAKQFENDKKVNDFSSQMEAEEGATFETLAKDAGWEVKTTDLFPISNTPAELNVSLRASSEGGKAIDELFRLEITKDPLSRFSQPIAIGENQWLVARLDEEEKPREKTYDEAKDEARVQYVKEKAAEAMKTKAKEAMDAIRKSLAEGKSFADAATAAGLKNVKAVEKVNQSYQPDPATEPGTLFQAARYITPGELAEPIIEADRAFVLFVKSREVIKNPNPEAALDSQMFSASFSNQNAAFNDWLTARRDAAKVEQLNRN